MSIIVLALLQWALDNDCCDEEHCECDECGRKTTQSLAYVWTDELVVCFRHQPKKEV